MLIYFGYSYCPDVCPDHPGGDGRCARQDGPSSQNRVVPIFITVDPERDTPAVLKAYLKAFGPRFVGLTGTPPTIARGGEGIYRVYSKKQPLAGGNYAMDHSSVIYLMGPDGKFVALLGRHDLGPDELAEELQEADLELRHRQVRSARRPRSACCASGRRWSWRRRRRAPA